MSFGGGGFGGFGQQNNNTTGGFGGFGATTNNNTTSAFGQSSTPAFGAPANNTTGGGLFGGTSGGGAFGGSGGFGTTANTGFGAAAKPAFGTPATTSAGGGLFGSTTATTGNTGFGGGGGFGTNNATTGFGGGNSLFGAANKAPSFGATNTTTAGTGGMFSGFGGGNTTTGFGTTANVGDPPGTNQVAFTPYQEKEANSNQTNSFQNILFQDPYKKFSAEELRMVDYAQGRRFGTGAAGGAGAFGATSGFGGTTTGFGANTATPGNTGFGGTGSTGLFGNNQQQNTGFGANTTSTGTTGFGTGGGGLFGANKPGGLFGSTTTATTQPAQTGGLFGNNTGTTGFGATNNNTGFGANANTTTNNLFGNNQQQQQQNKPFGGFGNTTTTPTPFGNNAGTTTGGFGTTSTTGNTGTGLFGNTAAQNSNTGGLFGNNQQQQQNTLGSGFGSTPFGNQQNQQQQTGGLFGAPANQNQQQQTGGLFGAPKPATGGTGLFGNTANTSSPFGQPNNQQQPASSLFGGPKPAAPGGGLFGNTAQQPNQGGTSLFGNLGNNQNQQQQPGSSLFGNLGNNQQQKPSLFGATAQSNTGGLFGQPQQQQQGTGLFGNTMNQQPQQQSILGTSLFNSQNQSTPQSLTASISDVNAYGTPSLFAGLGTAEVQNPGPLATPLSAKNKPPRKNSILPMWKLNPSSGSKLSVTPSKRGYGFSYSTYGSPVTPSSANSTPGGFGQSLIGAGNLNRSLSKSFSSTNLRRSINAEDTILSPGSFSASLGPGSRGSGRFNKLTVDRSLRVDLFSPVSKDKQAIDSPDGPRKLTKRVSFDTRNVDAENSSPIGRTPEARSVANDDLGYIRPTNGTPSSVNGTASRPENDTPEMEQVRGNELAIVHEEASPTPAAASASPAGDNGPGAYWMRPSKEEILAMNRVQRAQVDNFTVGRDNVGQVRFKVPVDLTSIDIDEIFNNIVLLETRSCTVYPVAEKKPLVGKGLNVPAEISLQHSWPRAKDKRTKLPAKSGRHFEKHVERLKSIPDTTFIDYDADQGIWTFTVEHFTTYGLDYDDEDTDGETLGEIVIEENAMSTQRKTTRDEDDNSPSTEAEDAFDFRRKRRALPGAFDYTNAVSDDEEEAGDVNQQSFLSSRSVGSTSQALVQHEGAEMDVEHALPEDQDASSYLGYHQAAEPEYDSPFQGSMAEYQQETPGGIMRARMRALKASNTPLKLQVADGDDWMDMFQKTISPQKRDRAALKTINEEETYESLKESVRKEASPTKPVPVSDGRGFATSIELMNSLFEKPKSPVRSAAPVTIPTSGFKWPYKRQDKVTEEQDNMQPDDRTFHDTLRPSWGPDGTLVLATAPKVLSRSSRRGIEKDGIVSMSRLSIVSENRDVRFAKFSNESSAKALNNQIALTRVNIVNNVPTVSLSSAITLTSIFHGQDLQSPSNAHEKMVWELAGILFDQVTDATGAKIAPSALRQARRQKVSKFWQNIVEDASNRDVSMAHSAEDKAIAALSGHRITDACKHLLDGKNFRLATLVALIGTSDQLMQDMREQVREWRDANVLSEFTDPIRAIYELLGGNVCAVDGQKGAMENRMESFVISGKFGLDWKRAFGLRLWYAITSNEDVVEAIHAFEDDLKQDKEQPPKPWFAEQGIEALWEDPNMDKREDLLWGLLKLYADGETDLADVLRPENSQLSPLDFRLCWQLGQALINTGKVNFGEDADDKADAATLSFASQLTSEGNWLEAVFVLLHLTKPAARSKTIQEHLARHVRLLGDDQSEDFITLTQVFKVPATWVWQAKALYMRSVKKDPKMEVVYLLRAASYAEAHKTFTKQFAPLAIIERDYESLWEMLAQFQGADGSISDWNFGGAIYRDFLELVRWVQQGKTAQCPPAVVNRLMAGLPAMHESVTVRSNGEADILEVAAVADMANMVAKVVVELAKKGETQLSKVLGLPLTEDAYLKYSNELAFAYYRDVMVGR